MRLQSSRIVVRNYSLLQLLPNLSLYLIEIFPGLCYHYQRQIRFQNLNPTDRRQYGVFKSARADSHPFSEHFFPILDAVRRGAFAARPDRHRLLVRQQRARLSMRFGLFQLGSRGSDAQNRLPYPAPLGA